MYEGGIKEPSFFYWKDKIKPGQVNEDVMLSMDILPTILEVAGIEYKGNKPFDGISQVNSLFNDVHEDRGDVFWMHTDRLVMRRGDLKLIRQNMGVELYDLAKDKREEKNLVDDPEYVEIVKVMMHASDEWHRNTAVGFPATRRIADPVKTPWPCKRDLKTFNGGKEYRWRDGEGVIE